jgi:hypothetical protein
MITDQILKHVQAAHVELSKAVDGLVQSGFADPTKGILCGDLTRLRRRVGDLALRLELNLTPVTVSARPPERLEPLSQTLENATTRAALRRAANYVQKYGGISPAGTGWDTAAYEADTKRRELDRDLYIKTLHREIARLQR